MHLRRGMAKYTYKPNHCCDDRVTALGASTLIHCPSHMVSPLTRTSGPAFPIVASFALVITALAIWNVHRSLSPPLRETTEQRDHLDQEPQVSLDNIGDIVDLGDDTGKSCGGDIEGPDEELTGIEGSKSHSDSM